MRIETRVIMIAAAIIATACTDDPVWPTHEPDKGNVPLVRFSETSPTVIYSAEHGGRATIFFETEEAEKLSVRTENGFTVTTELTRLEGNRWKLDLSEAEGMEKGREYSITITAENESGAYTAETKIEVAYMDSPFGAMEACNFGNTGKTFDLLVKGNVEWTASVDADEESWYDLAITSNSNLVFRIQPNETESSRKFVLTVSDKAGIYTYRCTYGQDRCDETQQEILSKEKAAIIAICEAFAIPYDSDTPYPVQPWNGEIGGVGGIGGIAEYNSRGYVTMVGLYGVTGVIPEEIGDLKHCKELIISNAGLSGKLPESIGDMISLRSLELTSAEGYGLEGNLSESSLSKIAGQLHHIDVAWNNFTGPCPEWLGEMPGNATFWIYRNRLEGKVPDKVQVHPDWNRVIPDGSGRLVKEANMKQQEGYVLYE